jgi:hypothetical protein
MMISVAQQRKKMTAELLLPAFRAFVPHDQLTDRIIDQVQPLAEMMPDLRTRKEAQVIETLLVHRTPVFQITCLQNDDGMIKIPGSRVLVIVFAEKTCHFTSVIYLIRSPPSERPILSIYFVDVFVLLGYVAGRSVGFQFGADFPTSLRESGESREYRGCFLQ